MGPLLPSWNYLHRQTDTLPRMHKVVVSMYASAFRSRLYPRVLYGSGRIIRAFLMTDSQPPQSAMEEVRARRIEKVANMRKQNVEPYAYGYDVNSTAALLHEMYKDLANGKRDESADVSISGRIMIRRIFGKLAFFELRDHTGSIQLYIDKKTMGPEFDNMIEWTDSGEYLTLPSWNMFMLI